MTLMDCLPLEVAIGPDAEVFTKSPVLSAVGWGDWIGVRSESHWSNPEPEIVLACDACGRVLGASLGASLGNDVNLRDIEGRSALLPGKAKDNNASCAIGPFIRLFDSTFTLADVRRAEVTLQVEGEDGYRLEGRSSMIMISRDPLELVQQTLGQHQYPDGFAIARRRGPWESVRSCATLHSAACIRGNPSVGDHNDRPWRSPCTA